MLKDELCFFEIEKSYLIRTFDVYLIGNIKNYSEKEILLENASWSENTKNFKPFINDVIINRKCIISMMEYDNKTRY